MFVSVFHAENKPEDKTKVILFGISLIPLLLNPVVTFGLRVDCRNEFIKHWSRLKKRFVAKKKIRKLSVSSLEICKLCIIYQSRNSKEILSVKESVYPDTEFCRFL